MNEKIEIYHAATEKVEHPICSTGRINLDFGQGFYLTDIYDQALMWAIRRSSERQLPAMVNVYTLEKGKMLSNSKSKIFDSYNKEWLDFIVACRSVVPVWKEYDYIEGGVANDRVINTVSMYMQGYMSMEHALERLRYLKPNNQICILNQAMLDQYLSFCECININDNGQL